MGETMGLGLPCHPTMDATDPHATLVRAVGGFLVSAVRKTNRFWGNCVALIECLPGLAAPSADALEQAERVARDWKEMVDGKPWSGRDMSQMAGWGLLTFLASYNIILSWSSMLMTSAVSLAISRPRRRTAASSCAIALARSKK
ncbi:uncharacterized protein C2845_PM01G37860 [Panicum miliaceum]|uniref:FRIGIDA-like protein n=1 Tax=Panicum miliaceum TaxID=4540 RepID=A0A3L6TSY6_PANMI|nr:uncharacterized protein C2845_PM01G37860 [Panicum miliaceum]